MINNSKHDDIWIEVEYVARVLRKFFFMNQHVFTIKKFSLEF